MNSNVLHSRISKALQTIKKVEPFNGYDDDKISSYILDRLCLLGIYDDDESLDLLESNDCTEGDARRIFCESGPYPLPPARFKRLWSILKNHHHDDNEKLINDGDKIDYALLRPYGQRKDKHLIAEYSEDCDNKIIDILSARSNNRPFVIFNDDKSINQELTLKMLREARRRETPTTYKVGDKLARLYRAGEFPNLYHIECPIHKRTLLTDGYCDESKDSWKGIDYECMQFARIVIEIGELDISVSNSRELIKIAKSGINELAIHFPHAALVFNEKKEKNILPCLKFDISMPSSSNDPLYSNKRY